MAINKPKAADTDKSTGKPLVLLIHPDTAFLKEYGQLLSAQGYEVTACQDGADAIAKVYDLVPDAVITDIVLPEINGYQICRLLKNDPVTQKIPVVLISNFEEKMDKFWGVKAGADLFLHHDELRLKLPKQVKMLIDIYNQISTDKKAHKAQIQKALQGKTGKLAISSRLNQILDKSLIESTLMADFRRLTDLVHDVNLINHMMFSLLESIIDYDAAAIFYNDADRSPRMMSLHLPEGKELSPAQTEAMKDSFFNTVDEDTPLFVREFDVEVIGETNEEKPDYAFKTVWTHNFYLDDKTLIGTLALYNSEAMDYPNIFPMRLIEEELLLLMKIRNVYSRAEMLAISDGLTGLLNYRHFMMNLEREFKASKRYEHNLTVAITDIDNFKQYNEDWGYTLGDEVIRRVALEAQKCFRSVDIIARLGGEELIIAFPKTSQEEADIALERFRKRIAEWDDENLNVTVSVGAAHITPEMQSVSDVMKNARSALDKAVKAGGNQISYYSNPS